VVSEKSAGQRLADELARDGDPVMVRELIGHAAEFADLIERCDELIQGKRSAWMQVKIGRDQNVEVRIGDVVRERRQLTTEMRHLFAEIHKQRAGITLDPEDDDVLDDDK
jgi:hypothetical protein